MVLAKPSDVPCFLCVIYSCMVAKSPACFSLAWQNSSRPSFSFIMASRWELLTFLSRKRYEERCLLWQLQLLYLDKWCNRRQGRFVGSWCCQIGCCIVHCPVNGSCHGGTAWLYFKCFCINNGVALLVFWFAGKSKATGGNGRNGTVWTRSSARGGFECVYFKVCVSVLFGGIFTLLLVTVRSCMSDQTLCRRIWK